MNCRECKEHLYEYLDRELTPAVEQEIRQHIADCPPCGEEFDFEKLFLGFVQDPALQVGGCTLGPDPGRAARRVKWLTPGGLVAACAVGAGVTRGLGLPGLALLTAFFLTGSVLTQLAERRGPSQIGRASCRERVS